MRQRTRTPWLAATSGLPDRRHGERGLALPMVLFMGVVLFLIVVAGSVRGLVGVNQADNQRKYNEALHTADGGADKVLFQLVEDKAFDTSTPANAGSSTLVPDTPSVALVTASDEKAWALTQAAKKAPAGTYTNDATLAALATTTGGEWAVIKPPGVGNRVLYAVGFTPNRAHAETTRVLRLEYDFPPFNAVNAILTGGNVKIGGSANIAGSAGSIHTNGNFSWTGGAWHVDGAVSASGSFPSGTIPSSIGNPAGSGGGKAPQIIPDFDPSDQVYYTKSQYDLCPDGKVRGGPANALEVSPNTVVDADGKFIPCSGPVLSAAGLYKGWELKTGKWTYQRPAMRWMMAGR